MLPEEPLVSVVIATFNRAAYLGAAIESVLAQTHKRLQVIVVDDGSTDDTRAVVQRYVPDVQYVWQENAERGAARNHGMRLAKGDYIAFLDSDDEWLPDKLETDLARFREVPQAGLVYSDAEAIDADGNFLYRIRRPGFEGCVTNHLLVNNFVSFSAHLARARLVESVGGFREERQLAGSEDWELWVRLSTVTEFAYSPRATARIRVHPANSMANASGMERSMRRACEIFESAPYLSPAQRRLLLRTRAMVALVSAINYGVAGNRKRAALLLLEAVHSSASIVADPRFAYTWMRLALPIALLKRLRDWRRKTAFCHFEVSDARIRGANPSTLRARKDPFAKR